MHHVHVAGVGRQGLWLMFSPLISISPISAGGDPASPTTSVGSSTYSVTSISECVHYAHMYLSKHIYSIPVQPCFHW